MSIDLLNYTAVISTAGSEVGSERRFRTTGYRPQPNAALLENVFEIELVSGDRLVLTAKEWDLLKRLMWPLEGM